LTEVVVESRMTGFSILVAQAVKLRINTPMIKTTHNFFILFSFQMGGAAVSSNTLEPGALGIFPGLPLSYPCR
jgi:hypothetical protein